MTARPALPAWPATMGIDLAMAYLDIRAEETFRVVTRQHGVRPVDLGVRLTRWRKADLDALVDKLPVRKADGCREESAPEHEPADPAEEALKRVEAGVGKGRRTKGE